MASKRITIRLNGDVLSQIRQLAQEEGLPYQTLISSVLHKYTTGRLVDRKYVDKE